MSHPDPSREVARRERGVVDQAEQAAAATADRWVVDLLLDYLELEGVEHIFGVPGGPLTPLFEALRRRRSIQFVLAKHECGAAFMANAYARTRRSLGVCVVTSGPGATNALTGAAAAARDSLPVLYLTAQVATKAFAKG